MNKIVALWTVCTPSSFLVVLYSNRILCFIVLLSLILALERADLMKNNNGFRFDIPKSIETDVNLPTKNIQFYPLLELHFAPRWGGHVKQRQIRFPHPQKYLQKYWNRYIMNYFNRKLWISPPFLGPILAPRWVGHEKYWQIQIRHPQKYWNRYILSKNGEWLTKETKKLI